MKHNVKQWLVGLIVVSILILLVLPFRYWKEQPNICQFKVLATIEKEYPIGYYTNSGTTDGRRTRKFDIKFLFNNHYIFKDFLTSDLSRDIKIGDTIILLLKSYQNGRLEIKNIRYNIYDYDDLYIHPVQIVDGKEIGNKYFYYAKVYPERVYDNFGFNIVYKATHRPLPKKSKNLTLYFTDISGFNKNIIYKLRYQQNILDTFLVFKNINDSISAHYTVCAPEINTPKNWAKISDYGYLFGYDEVYSKQEIESQCPRIKEYVEQYKKRTTPPTN
ncbi:MAG: hypothetical protein J6T70_04025 [Bacteroidales bacterium]|nr:hypothetical protein [Bacteroidales bacterium]